MFCYAVSMAISKVVSKYIEDISVKAFDHHSSELKEVIGHEGGIYCLYKNERLYYVGLAKNLFLRIKQHRKDKHKRKWNRFSAYVTKHDSHIQELESLTLRMISPPGNRKKGRLTGAKNLKQSLIREMKDSQRLHEAEMLGGKIGEKKRQKAAKGRKGSDALSSLAGRRRNLIGWRGNDEFTAVLHKSGKIKFDGVMYDSPSRAAVAALGRSSNGWRFWHYKDKNKEWAQLRNLK
jgi:hypothetical protein